MRVTLSEWIAFNEQLAGLAKVGIPLEAGLRDLAVESQGGLRGLSISVGERLERGESLDQVLAAEIKDFPPAYQGIIAAGLRSGDLGGALAAVSGGARRIAELRKMFAVASVYPMIIAVLAIVLGVAILVPMIWAMRNVFSQFRIEAINGQAEWFALADFWSWGWWLGFVALGLMAIWWWMSGGMRALRMGGPLALVPGVSRLMHSCDQLAAAEMLGTLVEREVPLPEALRLTAASMTRPSLRSTLQTWCDTVERGGQITGTDPLAVAIREGTTPQTLVLGLAQVVTVLRETVRAGVWNLTTALPALLGCVIGGLIVLAYSLGLVWPLSNFLHGLFRDAGGSPV